MTPDEQAADQEKPLPDRTVSDMAAIEKFYDDRLFRVVVSFGQKATAKDAARLKRVVPYLASLSISEIHQLISTAPRWASNGCNLTEAKSLQKAIVEQGLIAQLEQLSPTPDS